MNSTFKFYPNYFLKTINPSEGLEYKVFGCLAKVIKFHGKQRIVTIPPTFQGLPVTSISNYAFAYCENLQVVNIPDSVTEIGYAAFIKCSSLENICIPNSVSEIGAYAFAFTKLTKINIPDSITDLHTSTFRGCTHLKYIKGNSIIRIFDGAFADCMNLEEINFPELLFCAENAIEGCSTLAKATVKRGLLRNRDVMPFEFPASVKVCYSA